MAEMKQEPLETHINGLIVAEDMELVKHQVVIKNKIKDEEDLEDEVKEEIEPHQKIETLYEIEVDIPPDSTPICCSDCGRNFTKESQYQRHKCFVRHENVASIVQSKKTPLSKDPPPSVTVRESFCCPVCQKCFQWESHLQMHMALHSGGRKTFKNKSDYQRHLQQHEGKTSPKRRVSNKKPFLCPLCRRCFVNEKSIVRHLKRVHYMCPFCPKQCHNLSSVTRHERIHYRADGTLDYTPFSCSICKQSFFFQNILIEHRETSHNIGPFICLECGKHFISKDSLSIHEVNHFEGNHYKCSECNDGFPTKLKLQSHMKNHKKSFVCSVCQKTFQQEHGLAQHMESHVEEKPFKCSLCEKSFMLQRELLRHQRISHHICPLCSQRFSDRLKVDKHFLTHPRTEVEAYQRPFKCSECGHRFLSPSSLLHHQMSTHSEETPVECPVCQMRFKKKLYLTLHHKREHGNRRTFNCSLCKKRIKTKAGLASHMSLHHHLPTENQDESTPS